MMSDVENAYDQIIDFMKNTTEKTMMLSGIADKEKHQTLLKALNSQGNLSGLIYLIHTTKDGMENFFRWAELYTIKVPNKYGQAMRLSELTLYFDNLTTKNSRCEYDNIAFDFIIVWPIQSIVKNANEIQMLKEMADRQKTKKIIYLTLNEPWCNPVNLEPIVDRVIRLDCENDNPKEYERILADFEEEKKRRW